MRVGIVGIGWWSDVLAGVIARTDKLELRAGYSRSADKTAKFAETFGRSHLLYEEMLALDDLDGVILTTPNSAHRLGTEAAAAAGKHVFVEKPVSNTIADGRAMIAACEAANVVLAVGHSYRRHGALRHLKKMIDDGELGRVSHVEGVFSNDNGLKPKPGAWRTDPAEIPGGYLMQIGIHQIDNLLLPPRGCERTDRLCGPVGNRAGHRRRHNAADAVRVGGHRLYGVELHLPTPLHADGPRHQGKCLLRHGQ